MNIFIFLISFLSISQLDARGIGCAPCGTSCVPPVIYQTTSAVCMPTTTQFLAGQRTGILAGQRSGGRVISSAELIRLAHQADAVPFRDALANVVLLYRNQKKAFVDFINERDEDGYTIPMFFALIADLENLSITLEAIKQVIGDDPHLMYEIFKQKDTKKINLLGQAVYSADYRIIELVLARAIEFLGQDRELFFLFINAGKNKEGWKPLADAADESLSKGLTMMIKAADIVLGRDSDLFQQFINAQDQEGFTALDSAQNFTDKLLLIRSGEHEIKKTVEEQEKIEKPMHMGMKLIAASNRNDFPAFKEILQQGIAEFKHDTSMLFDFFYARDEAGWNALIHTAADGQYEFVQLLLNALEENFDEKDKYSKSIIIANVDFEGRTALHLAIARHHFDIAQLLLRSLMNYVVTKPFLLSLVNSPVGMYGFTPLMFLVYISDEYHVRSFGFLTVMLQQLAQFFGKESRLFWQLINSRDYNGWNVLTYASDHKTEKLLKSYGAIDTPMPKIPWLGKYFDRYSIIPTKFAINTRNKV